MVGKNEGLIGSVVGTRVFWKDPILNGLDCASLVAEWASRWRRLGEFNDLRSATAGDIVAFGTGWNDVTFGIYLDRGKIASTSRHPNCGGGVKLRMILLRIDAEKKPFIGGVHIG